jgi:hypothetical protein
VWKIFSNQKIESLGRYTTVQGLVCCVGKYGIQQEEYYNTKWNLQMRNYFPLHHLIHSIGFDYGRCIVRISCLKKIVGLRLQQIHDFFKALSVEGMMVR